MKALLLAVLLISSLNASAETQVRVGLFYDIGKKAEQYLYKQETKVEISDALNRTTESTIWNFDGVVLMREKATIKDGLIVVQVMEQLQINEKYVLNVKDGKAIFETFDTKNVAAPKLLESKSVKLSDNHFTGPSLEVFLKKNLDKLKSQKKYSSILESSNCRSLFRLK